MLLKKIAKRSRRRFVKLMTKQYDKPLKPSSEREKKLVEELRDIFRDLLVSMPDNLSGSEKEWFCNQKRLVELVLNDDPREFLRWDVIVKTMSVTFASYTHEEFRYLRNHSEWASRWSKAIVEHSVGHPVPYWRYPQSSENLIHHAYHISQFEDKVGDRISNFDFIFEFGGGYGNMCKLLHNLGFKGRYILFDFPAFSALQEFFLKCHNISLCPVESFRKRRGGVACISDLEQLRRNLEDVGEGSNSLFIATWSLSETPVEFRDSFFSTISSFGAFLIGYQDLFGEVNNVAFFELWKAKLSNIEWYDWHIEHIPNNNRYLVGKRKTNK